MHLVNYVENALQNFGEKYQTLLSGKTGGVYAAKGIS
jgi:hypothetical protein